MTLLDRILAEGTPLIDGEQVTFAWVGGSAPDLMGDFTYWNDSVKLTQIEPNIWTYTHTFPLDAYVEYAYFGEGDSRLDDPHNKRRVSNGMGKFNASFYMPEAKLNQVFINKRSKINLTKHKLTNHLGYATNKRDLWLYAPPVAEAVPLVVVYDGKDYLKRAYLPYLVESLISQGRIRPIALAMVDNHSQARWLEYNCSEGMLTAVLDSVIPTAQQHLNLLSPGTYGVMGASMGGLMALYTALRKPDIFNTVISQSGAFLPFTPELEPIYSLLLDTFKTPPPLKIWLDVGRLEWLLEPNRSLHARLKAWDVTYFEYNAGHNYPAWANALEYALPAVFGS